jgi:hypothetical protein
MNKSSHLELLSLEKRGLCAPEELPPAAEPAVAGDSLVVDGGIGGILEACCRFLSRRSGSRSGWASEAGGGGGGGGIVELSESPEADGWMFGNVGEAGGRI